MGVSSYVSAPQNYRKPAPPAPPAPAPASASALVAPAPAPASAPICLHTSPLLLSVLDCVINDRLAWAKMMQRRADPGCVTDSTTPTSFPQMHTHKKPPTLKKSPFHAMRPPSVSLTHYLTRLVRHSHCSRTAFITAMLYLDRVGARFSELRLNELNVHRLLLTAVLLATKMLEDVHYDNQHFAFVGGVDISELNRLELAMLKLLDYRLFVSVEEYNAYEAGLVHAVMASPNHAYDQLRLSLVGSQSQKRRHKLIGLPPSSPISVVKDNSN